MTDHQITIEEIKLLIDSKRAQIRIVEGLLETQRNDLRDLNSMKMSLSSLEVEEEGQQQELPTFGQGKPSLILPRPHLKTQSRKLSTYSVVTLKAKPPSYPGITQNTTVNVDTGSKSRWAYLTIPRTRPTYSDLK